MPSRERVWWAKLRTSSVILTALTILSVLFYLLTGGSLFEKKAAVYLYVPDASGLVVSSPVRVDGVDVGKVSRIELLPSGPPDRVIRLTLSIDQVALLRIPADSNAQLNAESVVGDMFVDVSSGTSRAPLRPGGEIAYEAQPELLKTLDLQQFDQALRSVDATLTDIEQGRSRVGQFVTGTAFYDDLRRNLREVETAFRDAVSISGTVGKPLYTDALYRRVRAQVIQLDRSLAAIQSGQGSLGGFLRSPMQYEQLHALVQGMQRMVAAIGAGPLLQNDQLYNRWNESLARLIRAVDEINANPLFLNSSLYDNLNGKAEEIRGMAHDFHLNPKAYMRTRIF